MILLNLGISDFGSFGPNQKIDFSRYTEKDKVLITGLNLDAAGADSNGAGKSQMLNAISWLIFGRVPHRISSDDVVRRGEKSCTVNGEFRDINNDSVTIIRSRRFNGKEELGWYINGESQTLRTNTQTQHKLLNHFGILENNTEYFNDFLNTTYFSIDAVKSFAGKNSTPKQRLDLISRFQNLEVLDKATSKAKVYYNNVFAEIGGIENQVSYLQNKLDSQASKEELGQVITDREFLIVNKAAEVKDLKAKLKIIESKQALLSQVADIDSLLKKTESDSTAFCSMVDEQLEELATRLKRRDEVESSINKLNQSLKNKSSSNLETSRSTIEQQERSIDSKITGVKVSSSSTSTTLRQIKQQLEQGVFCPKCEEPLMISRGEIKKWDNDKLKSDQKTCEKALAQENKLLGELKADQAVLIGQLNEIKEEIQSIVKDENSLRLLNKEFELIDNIPIKIKQLEENKEENIATSSKYAGEQEGKKVVLTFKLVKLKSTDVQEAFSIEQLIITLEDQLIKARDDISRNKAIIEAQERDKAELKSLKKQLASIQANLSQYSFWVEGFPRIRQWMIESFLPNFEQQTNHYLSSIEMGIKVRFDTIKEKKSGDGFKNTFDFAIIDEKRSKRDLETYSQGEAKRIGICVGFALRELTLNKGYNAFNFLMMDEVIDSLDDTGISEFFHLLDKISGLKLLISHNNDLKNMFSHTINVTKKEGITTVTQQ